MLFEEKIERWQDLLGESYSHSGKTRAEGVWIKKSTLI